MRFAPASAFLHFAPPRAHPRRGNPRAVPSSPFQGRPEENPSSHPQPTRSGTHRRTALSSAAAALVPYPTPPIRPAPSSSPSPPVAHPSLLLHHHSLPVFILPTISHLQYPQPVTQTSPFSSSPSPAVAAPIHLLHHRSPCSFSPCPTISHPQSPDSPQHNNTPLIQPVAQTRRFSNRSAGPLAGTWSAGPSGNRPAPRPRWRIGQQPQGRASRSEEAGDQLTPTSTPQPPPPYCPKPPRRLQPGTRCPHTPAPVHCACISASQRPTAAPRLECRFWYSQNR